MFMFPKCLTMQALATEPEEDGVFWSERHLQCIWADPRLRPQLFTSGGVAVEVIDPGAWNSSAGPDFISATIRIGCEIVRGDVEIHIRPRDWNAHGHNTDTRYDNVVLHVCWFPPSSHDIMPEIPLVFLGDCMALRQGFSFDQIDVESYPYGGSSSAPKPCHNAMANATTKEVKELLVAAGRQRIRRKSRELAQRIARSASIKQAFYAEIMSALGYRRNSLPMRTLAENVPVAELAAQTDAMARYALLLGSAGLLPREGTKGFSDDYVRRLWAAAFAAGASDRMEEESRWVVAGSRPINHPRIRLAAAAALFRSEDYLLEALRALPLVNPKVWVKLAEKVFRNYAQGAQEVLPPSKLYDKGVIGAGRIHAILVNAVIPFLAMDCEGAWRLCEAVPGEDLGSSMKEMAYRILGGDHNPALYTGSALCMQGLLELWHGYCTATPAACSTCPFAELSANTQNT